MKMCANSAIRGDSAGGATTGVCVSKMSANPAAAVTSSPRASRCRRRFASSSSSSSSSSSTTSTSSCAPRSPVTSLSSNCGYRNLRLLPLVASILLVLVSQCGLALCGWQEDARPRNIVHLADDQIQRFLGNQSHVDYFKLLERDGGSLLVGARNMVYNISLQTMTENLRLEWPSNEAHFGMCQMKGKAEDDCQNYIRVLSKTNNTHILVCGTNAYKPMCRYYFLDGDTYKYNDNIPGMGLCPYDSKHNSTAVFADGLLYVATVSDFSGTDPLIYREPLRTEQYDPKHLNAPNFVSSLSFGEHVYFFFRETAVEYINCGKTVYSRVARVCKNDRGSHKFANRWTSFLKARLNCSVGGEFPFYFNEIQSTTPVVEGLYAGNKESLIYAVFTTPPNSISGSAVCAFRMKDIMATFEGPFKEQETMNSNWLPVPSSKVPEPRPGQCVSDSRTLPDVSLNFIKSHTLMDQAVPAFWDHPLVIHTSLQYRFSQIAVDPQVRTADDKTYDVLFIGTDNGKVIKAINADSQDNTKPSAVIIEEIQVFPSHMPITNLHVFRGIAEDGTEESKLIVVSKEEIQAVQLARCYTDKILTCNECVKLQDPYCAWDEKRSKCTSDGSPHWNINDFVQNVALGFHPRCSNDSPAGNAAAAAAAAAAPPPPPSSCPPCPLQCPGACSPAHGDASDASQSADADSNNSIPDSGRSPISTTPQRSSQQTPSRSGRQNDIPNAIPTSLAGTDNKGPTYGASRESPPIYTAETLAIAVATSIIVALIVGFISGYLFSRRCRSDEVDTPYADDPNSFDGRGCSNRGGGGMGGGVGGAREPLHMNHNESFSNLASNNKQINLVLNVPPKNGNGKNANSAADTKPAQKVKKIYL